MPCRHWGIISGRQSLAYFARFAHYRPWRCRSRIVATPNCMLKLIVAAASIRSYMVLPLIVCVYTPRREEVCSEIYIYHDIQFVECAKSGILPCIRPAVCTKN